MKLFPSIASRSADPGATLWIVQRVMLNRSDFSIPRLEKLDISSGLARTSHLPEGLHRTRADRGKGNVQEIFGCLVVHEFAPH